MNAGPMASGAATPRYGAPQRRERAGPAERILWGAYGNANTGDALGLAIALHDSRAHVGESLAILSPRAALVQSWFPNARVIPYTPRQKPRARFWQRVQRRVSSRLGLGPVDLTPDWLDLHGANGNPGLGADGLDWVNAIRDSRELYLVGGGYLTDLFDLYKTVLPLLVANAASVPVSTAPIGIGPFRSAEAAELVAGALRPARVTVRDPSSLEFCRRHGIEAALQPDDVFRLGEVFPQWREDRHVPQRVPRVGINVNRQPGQDAANDSSAWWIDLLRRLQQDSAPLELHGFGFHARGRELEVTRDVFQRAGLDARRVEPASEDFRVNVERLAGFDLVITCRYHAVVLAQLFGIPYVAVAAGAYYSTKMAAAASGGGGRGLAADPSRSSPAEVAAFTRAALRDGSRAQDGQ